MDKGLGHSIKKLRELKNLSQCYVASVLGLSQPAYSAIENCRTRVDEKKLSQIAAALEVETDVIIKFSDKLFFQQYISQEEHAARVNAIHALYEDLIRQKEEEITALKNSRQRGPL